MPIWTAVVEKAESGKGTLEVLNKAMQKVERYKQAAAKMKGVDVAERLDTLRVLGDDLAIALDRLRVRDSRSKAKDTYLGEARSGGMKALTESAEGYFKKGRAPRLAATEHGLDQAESGALSAYTANEFQYINPATAFDKPWMQSQEKTKMMKGTEKERFEEGSLHGAMMMEAMAKLPVWTGEGFRGERLTPTQFEEQYTEDGSTVTREAVHSGQGPVLERFDGPVDGRELCYKRIDPPSHDLDAVHHQGCQRTRSSGVLAEPRRRRGALPGRIKGDRYQGRKTTQRLQGPAGRHSLVSRIPIPNLNPPEPTAGLEVWSKENFEFTWKFDAGRSMPIGSLSLKISANRTNVGTRSGRLLRSGLANGIFTTSGTGSTLEGMAA